MAIESMARVGEIDTSDTPVELGAQQFIVRNSSQLWIARLRLIWHHRRMLWRFEVAGLVISVLVALLIPSQYQSTVRLMPPDSQSNSAGLAMLSMLSARTGGLGAFAGDVLGMKSSGALFVGMLQSRTVQDRLVGQYKLKEHYRTRTAEATARALADKTTIFEDRKSGIIAITVTDWDPRMAAALAQAYVGQLDRLFAEVNTSTAYRERVFLEQRLAAVKQDLDTAARLLSEFASKNIAIDPKEQGRALVDAAALLQGQLIAAQTELEGLKQIYTGNNVRVRTAEARVSNLKQELEKLAGNRSGGVSKNAEESSMPSIRKLPELGLGYGDLYRRAKIEETVYETLTQQYELAKVQEAKETPIVSVLDPAIVAERRSYPPRRLIVTMGTLGALGFAVVWIIAAAKWQEIDPHDPRKTFVTEVTSAVDSYWAKIYTRIRSKHFDMQSDS